jgi:hypothetical protein
VTFWVWGVSQVLSMQTWGDMSSLIFALSDCPEWVFIGRHALVGSNLMDWRQITLLLVVCMDPSPQFRYKGMSPPVESLTNGGSYDCHHLQTWSRKVSYFVTNHVKVYILVFSLISSKTYTVLITMLSVHPLSTFEPFDRFLRNFIWTLLHWRPPQRSVLFLEFCNFDMAVILIHAAVRMLNLTKQEIKFFNEF